MDKIILIGRAGKDPEVIQTEKVNITKFTIATSEHYRDKQGEKVETTEWHNVVCFSNTATIAEKYIHKGDQVCIEGKVQTRSYEDKDGNKKYVTEVICNNIELLGTKKSEDRPAEPPAGNYERTGKYDKPDKEQIQDDTPTDEDSLPF